MASVPNAFISPEEYLRRERLAEYRSEYLDGQVFAMSGSSEYHSLMAGNVLAALKMGLKGGPCKAYTSDLRVLVKPSGLYTYPDVSAVCGQPEFLDGELDTLMNPILLVEVLSPSTERYDRGRKLAMYRKVASLREYLLIAQDRIHVENGVRQPDGKWVIDEADQIEDSISLTSLNLTLPLRDIYDQVEFS